MNLARFPSAVVQYAGLINSTAAKYGISPWLLVGILWRESNAGLALKPQGPAGTGDFGPRSTTSWPMAGPNGLPPDGGGWGRGLMQIDYGVHNAWVRANNWADPAVNIDKAGQIMKANLTYFSSVPKTPGVTVGATVSQRTGAAPGNYSDPRPLKGALLEDAALAAYNAGTSYVLQAVAAAKDPSLVTTGGDYAPWVRNFIAKYTV